MTKEQKKLIRETNVDYGSTGDDLRSETLSREHKKRVRDEKQNCCSRIYPTGFLVHLKSLLKTSWVLVVTMLCQFTYGLVAVMFCGQLGKFELDAVALANSLINVLGVSCSVGLSSACDTLFSQIYGTDKKFLAGIVLQRSMIIMFLATLPLFAIHLNAQRLLTLLGQDPLISQMAGEYLLIFLPALVFYPFFMSVSKFLQNQKIIFPTMIFGITSNVVNIVLHAVFVIVLEWGTTGSAIAQCVSYNIMTLMNAVYVLSGRGREGTWKGWTLECFQEWGQFTNLALFGFLMTCIEWWAFEFGIFLSGVKGTTELGAQSVMFQFESVMYMITYGVSIAASISVGTYLGESRPGDAKTVANVGLTVAAVIGTVFALVFFFVRDYLPYIFTSVPEVIAMATEALPVLAVFTIFDALCNTYGGIVRGTGRQYVGAGFVTLGYIIALAIGIPLLFLTPLSVTGFWIGLAVAMLLVSMLYTLFVCTRSWKKEVESTRKRVEAVSTSVERTDEKESSALLGSTEEDGDPVVTDTRISGWSLVWRRGAIIAFSCGVFVAGVVCRLVFPPPDVRLQLMPLENGTIVTTMEPLLETTT